MNQRIRLLAEQADWRFADRATGHFSEYDKKLEKFAELIIRECLDFCRHEPNDDPYDSYDIGYDSATQNIRKAIQVHFGVEE